MKMYRGDLKPDLIITCTDGYEADGVTPKRVDLTTATSIRVIGVRDGAVLFDDSATGDAQGEITRPWQVADTATAGFISVEAEVTWPGSRPEPQTFRVDEVVEVLPDFA